MSVLSSQKLKAQRQEIEAAVKVLNRLAATLEAGRRVDPALLKTAGKCLRACAGRGLDNGARSLNGKRAGSRRPASQETDLALADFIPGLSEALRHAGHAAGQARGETGPWFRPEFPGLGLAGCLTLPPLSDRNYTD